MIFLLIKTNLAWFYIVLIIGILQKNLKEILFFENLLRRAILTYIKKKYIILIWN